MLFLLTVLIVLALPAGVLAARLRAGPGRVAPSAAGALLLAIALGDLLPDALADGASSDLPGGVVLLVVVAASAAVTATALLRRRPGSTGSGGSGGSAGGAGVAVGCCSGATGFVAATALATHGAVEGLVVGLGAGLGQGAAVAVVAGVALHRFAEGFALGTALRQSGTRRATGLVVLASVSPLAGGLFASSVTLGEDATAVVTAALGGLLAAVAATLLTVGPGPRPAPVAPRTPVLGARTPVLAPGTPGGLEPGAVP